jgi:hypothetical protein
LGLRAEQHGVPPAGLLLELRGEEQGWANDQVIRFTVLDGRTGLVQVVGSRLAGG